MRNEIGWEDVLKLALVFGVPFLSVGIVLAEVLLALLGWPK